MNMERKLIYNIYKMSRDTSHQKWIMSLNPKSSKNITNVSHDHHHDSRVIYNEIK